MKTTHRAVIVLAAALWLFLGVVAPALAWVDDGIDQSASGQAIYEDMMIHPQAVHAADGRVYVVYQGANLVADAVALDVSGTAWQGPFQVGANPLTATKKFDDTHGAPSLLIDRSGRLHVYWGSHGLGQTGAVSNAPFSIVSYSRLATRVVPYATTYPQPIQDAVSGVVTLYSRLDMTWRGSGQGSWMRANLGPDASGFVSATPVAAGDSRVSWYPHTQSGVDGRTHLAMVANMRTPTTDPYSRFGVYYMYSDADGVWRDVKGFSVASNASTHGVTLDDLTTDTAAVVCPQGTGEHQNQVSVADDGSGRPGIIYVTGAGFGPTSHRWVFARWGGSSWATTTIAPTDHAFDSGTLEYSGGGIDAFLTVAGGSGSAEATSSYDDRGGDIVWFRSTDNGAHWSAETTIAAANRDLGVAFGDPQIVVGHDAKARVLFGEWDNDGANFVHRIFLWGSQGYRQREFFPSIKRAGGPDRYHVAVAASKQTFPLGAHTAVLVSGGAAPDALAAVPLATRLIAPVLLTSTSALPKATRDELVRLRCDKVEIIGGTGSVSAKVASSLVGIGAVRTVTRIGGADRYAVAAGVAAELARQAGAARSAFVVNGDAWADGLAAAAVAAQRGAPVLLVSRAGVPATTAHALRSLAPSAAVIAVGGEGSVPASVAASARATVRVQGADRYATAANLATLALDGTTTVSACSTMRRFVVASGDTFADALSTGVLCARGRGPLLLTRAGALPEPTADFLDERAYRVYQVTIAGGEASVSDNVANQLAEILTERQAQ